MGKRRNQRKWEEEREASRGRGGKVVQPKEPEVGGRLLRNLVPRNENQQKALQALRTNQIIALSGSAGTGKTALATWWASKQWSEGEIDTIVVTRGDAGFGDTPPVPGNDTEKMMVMCYPALLNLKKNLGGPVLKNNLCMIDSDILFKEVRGIVVMPLAKLGGMSFDHRTLVIADEMQASTIPQIKALTTRPENGCQLIITGDTFQTPDKCKENGLEYFERILTENVVPNAALIHFNPNDDCRKGTTGYLTRIYESEGRQW